MLGYYGAWLRNNTIKKLSCLSTHPDWMSKNKNILENMTLGSLFIPGTHNSGSYSEETSQTILQRYTVTQVKNALFTKKQKKKTFHKNLDSNNLFFLTGPKCV